VLVIAGEMTSGDFTCIVGNVSSVVTVCGEKVLLLLFSQIYPVENSSYVVSQLFGLEMDA